jgi:hypothetical protein
MSFKCNSCIMQVYGLMEQGQAQRATGPTKLNEMSSRSHAVFIVIVEKSSILSDPAGANDDEMQQFRGLAPGTIHKDTWTRYICKLKEQTLRLPRDIHKDTHACTCACSRCKSNPL